VAVQLLERVCRKEIFLVQSTSPPACAPGTSPSRPRTLLLPEALAWREVVVIDAAGVGPKAWPRLRVVSMAPVIAGALERLLADSSIGDLYRAPATERAARNEERHNAPTTVS
jgi:hypothetical protein